MFTRKEIALYYKALGIETDEETQRQAMNKIFAPPPKPSTISEYVSLNLSEKVKELEAQRDWLASKLGDMCSVSNRDSCGVPEPCPYSKGYCRCLDAGQEEWVQVVKEVKC